nr:hypothetical protein [uncultured Prevotella sp.]
MIKLLLDEFCLSRLYCKVSLCKGNMYLSWFFVLCDKIAGVTGKKDVFNLTLCSGSQFDHFPDARKLVIN